MNADGKMDRTEFSIAMHLISKKLQSYELPRVLPASMKQEPVAAGAGTMASGAIGGGFGSMGMPLGGAGVGGGAHMTMQPRMPMQMGEFDVDVRLLVHVVTCISGLCCAHFRSCRFR